jgi:hypothetical protein
MVDLKQETESAYQNVNNQSKMIIVKDLMWNKKIAINILVTVRLGLLGGVPKGLLGARNDDKQLVCVNLFIASHLHHVIREYIVIRYRLHLP